MSEPFEVVFAFIADFDKDVTVTFRDANGILIEDIKVQSIFVKNDIGSKKMKGRGTFLTQTSNIINDVDTIQIIVT